MHVNGTEWFTHLIVDEHFTLFLPSWLRDPDWRDGVKRWQVKLSVSVGRLLFLLEHLGRRSRLVLLLLGRRPLGPELADLGL